MKDEIMLGMQIPVIKLNEVLVEKKEKYISVFYSINDPSHEDSVFEKMYEHCKDFEPHFPFDFRQSTKIGNKKWSIAYLWSSDCMKGMRVNCYENSFIEGNSGLISNNDKTYEKIFWFIGIPKERIPVDDEQI